MNKYAELYRKAAAKLARSPFLLGCCEAIDAVEPDFFGIVKPAVMRLAEFFDQPYGEWWWGRPVFRRQEDHEARIFALLLAAEVAEEEGWE